MGRIATTLLCCTSLIMFACDDGDDGSGGAGGGAATDRSTYPVENVGKAEGKVLANLTFTSPDESSFSIGDIYADAGNRLLLVSTSAGWCTACIEEQPKLIALHDEFADQGLFILITLFEDDQFAPSDAALAGQWQRRFDLPFTVVSDPEFQFGDYYNRDLTPMTMLVDVDSMTILKITTGFPENEVRSIINAAL